MQDHPTGLGRVGLVLALQVLDESLVLAHVKAVVEVGQPLVEAVLFLVGHAAGHGDGATGTRPLPGLQLAEPSIRLLFGVLTDRAGDEDREVGLVEVGDGAEAGGRQPLRQIVRVRLIHLAAAHPEVKTLTGGWALVPIRSRPPETQRLEG